MSTPSAAGPANDPGLSGAFRIDREGAWRHEGVEVTHPGVLRNLFANLRVEGEHYHLQAGPWRIPVQVDDTPFVVISTGAGSSPDSIDAHLSDDSQEPLDVESLMLERHGTPYCRVKGGRFRARLSVAAWFQLAEKIEPDSASGAPILVLGGRRIALRSSD